MSRASNDLADIVASIPTGQGSCAGADHRQSDDEALLSSAHGKACAYAKCLDANGNPMQGVAVRFTWNLSSGPVSAIAYTDSKGVAHHWNNAGKSPLMRKTTVTASARSSGATRSDGTWFMATPVLDDGREGIRTSASDHSPAALQHRHASRRCAATAPGEPSPVCR